MKTKFTMFRRGAMFYMQDSATGKQTSLRTKDEAEATQATLGELLAAEAGVAVDQQRDAHKKFQFAALASWRRRDSFLFQNVRCFRF